MNEPESPYFPSRGLLDLIMQSIHTPNEIMLAYLDLFSTPMGQLVLEDLFRELCFGQSEPGNEIREQGKHDAFLMIRYKMAQGALVRRRGDGWITHEDDR